MEAKNMLMDSALDSISVVFIDSDGDVSDVTFYPNFATICVDRTMCAVEIPNLHKVIEKLLDTKNSEEIEKTVNKMATNALWFMLKQF